MDQKRRDFLRGTVLTGASAGAVGLGAVGMGSAGPAKAASPPPRRPRVLLRGGYLLTLDPKLGDFRGDLLIDGGRIAAIGQSLSATGADVVDARDMVILPGFIESHRHTWQSSLRHLGADWILSEYIRTMFARVGIHYRPQDVYAGNLLGRLSALESGITTMLDWSHIMNTPEHADAAIQGLRDAGVRSVFAMGWPQTPDPFKWIARSSLDLPDDIRRVRKQHFSGNNGLVTLQMAARGPTFAVMEQVARDLETARDLGINSTMHGNGGGAIAGMQKAGIKLGPDITYVHWANVTNEELDLIKSSGGTVSISPLGESWHSRWQEKPPATMRFLRAGIKPSLSVDTEAFAPGDMFSTMKGTLGIARYSAANPDPADAVAAPTDIPNWNPSSVIPARTVLELATIAGARPLGLDGQVGALSPGMQADILCLRASHLHHFPLNDAVGMVVMAADTASVDAVFVAGKAVKFNGRLVNDALVQRAKRLALESREYLLEKSGLSIAAGLRKS